jgi:hypothetical protein
MTQEPGLRWLTFVALPVMRRASLCRPPAKSRIKHSHGLLCPQNADIDWKHVEWMLVEHPISSRRQPGYHEACLIMEKNPQSEFVAVIYGK